MVDSTGGKVLGGGKNLGSRFLQRAEEFCAFFLRELTASVCTVPT